MSSRLRHSLRHALRHPTVGKDVFIHHTARVGGPPEFREYIFECKDYMGVVVHDDAWINAYVTIDCGTVRDTVIGARTMMLAHSHAGHDVIIGDDCNIATGAILGGFSTIGNNVRIGIGALILPYRTVGEGAIIGSGAVVTKDVPPGVTVAGNPARMLETNPIPFTER